ncbi:unnamed protein product [Closterium sp. NIES-53]
MALHPSSVTLCVPLLPPPKSSLPAVPDPESDLVRAASPTFTRLFATVVTDPSFESIAASALVAELVDFAAVCHLDYATSLVAESKSASPPSVVEAIMGPYSFQRKTAMDAEIAYWKSTGTYVDAVSPSGANIAFKAHYVARGFSQRQGADFFHTFSPTPKMTTQGSLHKEIWLCRPPGFTRSFLAALGFAPSTADPSLFLSTDTSLPLFYILVYVDDLVFATADTETLALVMSELLKRHTCTDLGELRSYLGLHITRDRTRHTITLTQSHMVHQVFQRFAFRYSSPQSTPLPTHHSLSAPPSDESVEPSGLYPELVGCLMYLTTCTRPDLAYPLSILPRYVAPRRHRREHWEATKRVLRYLCSTLGMGLVLGGWGLVVLTRHGDASWVYDLATQRSSHSTCESEIYARAMAAQELHWLTYLLTDLGERPCSSPQRGQLRLAYVATRANIADIFTKALQSAYFAFLDSSCDYLFSPTLTMGSSHVKIDYNQDIYNITRHGNAEGEKLLYRLSWYYSYSTSCLWPADRGGYGNKAKSNIFKNSRKLSRGLRSRHDGEVLLLHILLRTTPARGTCTVKQQQQQQRNTDEPRRFMPHLQPASGQEKTLDALQVQSHISNNSTLGRSRNNIGSSRDNIGSSRNNGSSSSNIDTNRWSFNCIGSNRRHFTDSCATA